MTRFPFPFADRELTRAEFIKKYNLIFDREIRRCFAEAKPVNNYLADVELAKKYSTPLPEPQQNTGSYSVGCEGGGIYLFEIVEGKYKFTEIGAYD
jgi:hypothetical protein